MKQLIPNANFDRTLRVGTLWQMDLPLPTRLPPQMSGALTSAPVGETLPEKWFAQSHSAFRPEFRTERSDSRTIAPL
jgi:hypothetical protein